VLKLIASVYLKVFGWRTGSEAPSTDTFVLIAAPHTSNWDGVHMVALSWVFGIRIRFMAKHTLFEGKWGWFFRWVGGVPVDRRKPQGLVEQMVEQFERGQPLILGVPPEGTRSRREYWKSGFYQIAVAAKVPIVMGYLDFAKKEGGFGGQFMPSGDIHQDMDVIRAFYATKSGKYPELFAVPRLRAEDDPPDAASRTTQPPGAEGPAEEGDADKTPGGPDAEGAEAA